MTSLSSASRRLTTWAAQRSPQQCQTQENRCAAAVASDARAVADEAGITYPRAEVNHNKIDRVRAGTLYQLGLYFLGGAFIVPDEALRRVLGGAVFVIPFRVNEAFEALVLAGIDLTLDPRVTELNGLGPAVLLFRVCAAIQLLPQMLELQIEDLVDIEACDPVVDEDTWPSHLGCPGFRGLKARR